MLAPSMTIRGDVEGGGMWYIWGGGLVGGGKCRISELCWCCCCCIWCGLWWKSSSSCSSSSIIIASKLSSSLNCRTPVLLECCASFQEGRWAEDAVSPPITSLVWSLYFSVKDDLEAPASVLEGGGLEWCLPPPLLFQLSLPNWSAWSAAPLPLTSLTMGEPLCTNRGRGMTMLLAVRRGDVGVSKTLINSSKAFSRPLNTHRRRDLWALVLVVETRKWSWRRTWIHESRSRVVSSHVTFCLVELHSWVLHTSLFRHQLR